MDATHCALRHMTTNDYIRIFGKRERGKGYWERRGFGRVGTTLRSFQQATTKKNLNCFFFFLGRTTVPISSFFFFFLEEHSRGRFRNHRKCTWRSEGGQKIHEKIHEGGRRGQEGGGGGDETLDTMLADRTNPTVSEGEGENPCFETRHLTAKRRGREGYD